VSLTWATNSAFPSSCYHHDKAILKVDISVSSDSSKVARVYSMSTSSEEPAERSLLIDLNPQAPAIYLDNRFKNSVQVRSFSRNKPSMTEQENYHSISLT